ncbi:MAG: Ig domain-containing protein [Selenomonadaceae bacterium]|nr:Ig domain-containing protein [Selenomonadaceae bacterium]
MKKIFSFVLTVALILCTQLTFAATRTVHLNFQTYVEGIGWQKSVGNGKVAGTVGEGKRLEALLINLMDGTNNMIQYNVHVQNVGWQGWRSSGEVAGTLGRNLRIEAVSIRLVGNYANLLDVYYRAHVQNGGWLGWAANGEPAGTAGAALRMEALQIQIVPKGTQVNRGGKAYYEKNNSGIPTI